MTVSCRTTASRKAKRGGIAVAAYAALFRRRQKWDIWDKREKWAILDSMFLDRARRDAAISNLHFSLD